MKVLKEYKRKKKIATIKKYIGYVFVAAVIVASNYIGIVVAANSSFETVQGWTTSFLISLGQDLVTGQIAKVVITIVAMKLITRGVQRNRVKYFRPFLDPITTRALMTENSLFLQKKPPATIC